MEIRFGLSLDGQRGWANGNRLGKETLGPVGFLALLEARLGLAREYKGRPARIIQYLEALRRRKTPSSFYSATLKTDEIGTAAELLDWRDEWYLHGWDGAFASAVSPRLAELSQVEADAATAVDLSIGQRLAKVSQCLDRRKTGIGQVTLMDPLEMFPKRWREVLDKLPTIKAYKETPPSGTGFLHELQEALRSVKPRAALNKVPWKDDGTVTVLQAETAIMGGHWLADHIGGAKTPGLIVSSGEGMALDEIFKASGLPYHGLPETSAFRPTLQVLRLALELLWEPLNYHALMQFLTHPVCPVRKYARYQLAEKNAEKPGITGRRWDEVLENIRAHYQAKAPDDVDKIMKGIQNWICHERYTSAEAAPVNKVMERVGMVKEYFQGRMAAEGLVDRVANKAGFAQAKSLYDALMELTNQSVDRITHNQLQKLISHATARGSENPLMAEEVGCHLVTTDPAAVIEPVDWVAWWRPGQPDLPKEYPWSSAEIDELKAAGVDIPPLDSKLEHYAKTWLRPVLAARKQLTLILPPPDVEAHPIWQKIQAVTDSAPVVKLEEGLAAPAPSMHKTGHKPLPLMKRWWKLPAGSIAPGRDRDSYSSLQLFLFNPYQWALKYQARLYPSKLLTISDEYQLNGNLAHSLVERYYNAPDWRKMKDGEAKAWFQANMDLLLKEEGATLLMHGRMAELHSFNWIMEDSFMALRKFLLDSKVIETTPEHEAEGKYTGGKIHGYADLVLKSKTGEIGIIDMKWSNEGKYHDALARNTHLQLAIYSHLLRANNGGSWPHAAYFIFDVGSLMTDTKGYFAGAEVVTKKVDETTEDLWNRFIETYKWRLGQVNNGELEVVLNKDGIDPKSIPPANAMTVEILNPRYNDYVTLAGWSVGQ